MKKTYNLGIKTGMYKLYNDQELAELINEFFQKNKQENIMEYIIENKKYYISYQELKAQYNWYCEIPDEDFLKRLPKILHIACIICFLKELPVIQTVSDEGIIHQLVHLIDNADEPVINMAEIRELFKETLRLV